MFHKFDKIVMGNKIELPKELICGIPNYRWTAVLVGLHTQQLFGPVYITTLLGHQVFWGARTWNSGMNF